jgi:hypothetical protein
MHVVQCTLSCCRTLGATDPFFDTAASTLHYPFHDIDEAAYEQAFQLHKLSGTSRGKAIAETLQVIAGLKLQDPHSSTPGAGPVPVDWDILAGAPGCTAISNALWRCFISHDSHLKLTDNPHVTESSCPAAAVAG